MVEAALVADIDSGIVLAGFAGFVLCFPSLSSGTGCAASCAVWTRRTVPLRDSGFSVEPLVSGSHVQCLPRRRHTGIGFFWEMTSMSFCIQHNAVVRQRIHAHEVAALPVDTGSGMCFAGLLESISLVLCSLWLAGP